MNGVAQLPGFGIPVETPTPRLGTSFNRKGVRMCIHDLPDGQCTACSKPTVKWRVFECKIATKCRQCGETITAGCLVHIANEQITCSSCAGFDPRRSVPIYKTSYYR